MRFLDTSSSQRIAEVMEMVGALGRLSDPCELMDLCVPASQRGGGQQCHVELSTAGLRAGQYRVSRLMTHDGVEHRGSAEGDASPVRQGGLLGAIVATPTPKLASGVNAGDDEALGAVLAPYRSLMAAPVFSEGAPATWLVLLDVRDERFGLSDLEDLIVRVNMVRAVVGNLRTARDLFQANMRIQSEIDRIAQIQRALLPAELPRVPGLRIGAACEPCEQAGGDLYDVVRLGGVGQTFLSVPGQASVSAAGQARMPVLPDGGRWAIVVGDVCGHGPAAAVLMAMFSTILHAPGMPAGGAGELLTMANQLLCQRPLGECFITAAALVWDPLQRRMSHARAGHPPAILLSGGERRELADVGGPPLGISADAVYGEETLSLRSGDGLILYTDGVSEAADSAGRQFGREGIVGSVRPAVSDPREAVRRVLADVRAHQGRAAARDDQTVVVITRDANDP
jgi:sigma-B regulation protein RsbU (phosphoserine phosphatase)